MDWTWTRPWTAIPQPAAVKILKQGSADVRYFLPPYYNLFTGKLLYRANKKILLADGCRAIVGGSNLGSRYLARGRQLQATRPTRHRSLRLLRKRTMDPRPGPQKPVPVERHPRLELAVLKKWNGFIDSPPEVL